MNHGLRLVVALFLLAVFVLLARVGIERQRQADALNSPFDALRHAQGEPEPDAGPAPPVLRGRAGRRPARWLKDLRLVPVAPETSGVDFVHTWGGGGMDNLVKASGGGVTLFDCDGDGDDDLYLVQGASDPVAAPGRAPIEDPRNRLYRNDGDWHFTDITEESGLGDRGYGMGAAPADFDGDGDLDLFVANHGPDRLYRNDGGVFTDITAAAGIATDGCSVGAAWGDADGDGRLDLVVCGYVVFDPDVKPGGPGTPFAGPGAFRGETMRLLLGRADGTFEDVTREAGLWSSTGRGMGVALAPLGADGGPLLVVANDSVANFAYERRADGTWVETAFVRGLALSDLGQKRASMGVTVLDADRDGLLDVLMPDATGNTLYMNLGDRFEDRARVAGIDTAMKGRTGWSATPLDVDLDGFPDLLLSCGGMFGMKPEVPILFRNLGDGRFRDVSASVGLERSILGRGAAAADLDGDGDPDLVVAALGAPPLLLRNDGAEERHALRVRVRADGPNRDGLGARVEVHAGGLVQVDAIRTTQGYLAGGSPVLHFGLGDAATADRVVVVFPSGAERVLKDVPAGTVTVEE